MGVSVFLCECLHIYISLVLLTFAAIFYHVKRVQVSEDGGAIYCLWISRDSEAPYYQARYNNKYLQQVGPSGVVITIRYISRKFCGDQNWRAY